MVVSRPVGGVLSSASRRLGDHPSVRSTRGCLGSRLGGRAARAPCSTLLRVGFTEPPVSPPTLVRSYRTVSPLPVRVPGEPVARHRRSVLCGTVHQVALPGSRQHPALRSPDLPRHGRRHDPGGAGRRRAAVTRPTHHEQSATGGCRRDRLRQGSPRGGEPVSQPTSREARWTWFRVGTTGRPHPTTARSSDVSEPSGRRGNRFPPPPTPRVEPRSRRGTG